MWWSLRSRGLDPHIHNVLKNASLLYPCIEPFYKGREATWGFAPLENQNTSITIFDFVNVLNPQKKKSVKYYKNRYCKIKKVHCKITKNLQKPVV